jgi:transcription elongation factor Elf1
MAGIGANPQSQTCPYCGTGATTLQWSETVEETEIAYIWRCMGCGNEFETKDKAFAQAPTGIELVQAFLPNLVVA